MISNLTEPGASGVSILVHAMHVDRIVSKICISSRVMAIDLQFGGRILRIIAVYLPNAGHPWNEFEVELERRTMTGIEGRNQGKYVIIAGDFNLSASTVDRGSLMQDLCNQLRLNTVSGEGRADAEQSWTYRARLGGLRRIDFILVSIEVKCRESCTSTDLDLGSDHRCVKATLEYERPQSQLKIGRKPTRRWYHNLDENGKATSYQARLEESINEGSQYSLKELEEIIRNAASRSGGNQDRIHGQVRPEKSPELKQLIRERRLCRDAAERKRLRKRIFRMT